LAVGVGLCLASRPASALQGGEDPALLPVLVDKRFGNGGRHQLSLQFSTAFATKFVEATGGTLSYGYNFSDLIGFEIYGGGFIGNESSIMDEVRAQFGAMEPPLSDLYQLQWSAGADLVLVPFYGKMSFASEVDPAYDLYALLGGGVAGLRRQVGADDVRTFESKTGPAFNFGFGLRFYFTQWLGLRLEFRDYFFPDPEGGFSWNLHFQGGFQFNFGGGR
jgi:outer membrane beta-barrel protein